MVTVGMFQGPQVSGTVAENLTAIEAAARRDEFGGLKRWITVGTPFVGLRKERLLFTRLKDTPDQREKSASFW